MKNKEIRKIQFGGWSKRDYREIRNYIKRIDKESWLRETASRETHNLENLVQFQEPELVNKNNDCRYL